MKTILLSGIFVLSLTGCGGSSHNDGMDTPPPPMTGVLFPESELWDQEVQYRGFGNADKTSVTSVTRDQSGNLCYIVSEAATDDITISPSHWQSRVECRNNAGEVFFHHTRLGKGVIKQVMYIPDGRFIVAELIEAPIDTDSSQYFLQLTMFSTEGGQSATTVCFA